MSCLPSVFASFRHLCVRVRTHQEPGAAGRRGRTLSVVATLATLAVGAVAQAPPLTFPGTPVGTPSAEVTVPVTFQITGEVAKVKVLTLGAPGLDFAAGTGVSCVAAERTAG